VVTCTGYRVSGFLMDRVCTATRLEQNRTEQESGGGENSENSLNERIFRRSRTQQETRDLTYNTKRGALVQIQHRPFWKVAILAERHAPDALLGSKRREHYPKVPELGLPGVIPSWAVQQGQVLFFAMCQPPFPSPLPRP
jgi:hypothetical protein